MIVEYRMLVTESLGHNRAALMAALKEHNVKTAIVTYSGAGDSGDVDGVETIPQEAIKALEASKVTMRLPKGEFVDGQYIYRKKAAQDNTLAGGLIGLLGGALLGPAGAVLGAGIGAAVGNAIDPDN